MLCFGFKTKQRFLSLHKSEIISPDTKNPTEPHPNGHSIAVGISTTITSCMLRLTSQSREPHAHKQFYINILTQYIVSVKPLYPKYCVFHLFYAKAY